MTMVRGTVIGTAVLLTATIAASRGPKGKGSRPGFSRAARRARAPSQTATKPRGKQLQASTPHTIAATASDEAGGAAELGTGIP